MIASDLDAAFAVSLDHDLHVPGLRDAGDGLQVATRIAALTPSCPVIIHTSNGQKSREMQGVLEAESWPVRLAGAIGEDWIEQDWITEVMRAYQASQS